MRPLTRILLSAALFTVALFATALAAKAQTGITDLVVARKVNFQGVTAPAALTGNTNDYAPAGFANATVFKLSSTLNVNITGLAGGTPGRLVWVVNVGTFDLTIQPQSTLSLAANRFAIVGPTVIPPGVAVSYIYDGAMSRWIGLEQGKSTAIWGSITGNIGDQTDLNDAIATLAKASLTTGVVGTDDTVLFSAPNTSTLRIAALAKGVYSTLLGPGQPVVTAIKSFPQQDYPLSSLGLVADGTYARWIGYNSSGVVVTSSSRFTNDSSVIGLGIIVVKRVSGVTTFIDDGGPRSFLTSPQMAQFSTLERAVIGGFKGTVTVTANSTDMTLQRSAGTITGISANWASSGNKNVLDLAAVTTAPFIQINPSIAAATSLPAAVTTLTATNYWNGSASVALGGTNHASVKRVLLGVKGGLFIQEGEVDYSTLDAAVAADGLAPFTTLLAQDLFIEIGRIAVVKNATNLSDPTQARFFITGGGSAGSSGGGGSSVTSVNGTVGEIAASAPVGAVTLSLPSGLVFTGKTITGGTYTGAASVGAVGDISTTTTGTSAQVILNNNAGTSFNAQMLLQTAGTTKAFVGVAGGAGNLVTGSAAGDGVWRQPSGALRFSFDGGSTTHGAWNSTGLAVTGAISSTGNITTGNNFLGTGNTAANYRIGTDTNFANGGQIQLSGSTAGNFVSILSNGTNIAQFGSTGLTITGTFSGTFPSSGGLALKNSDDTSGTTFAGFLNGSGSLIGSVTRVTTTNAVAYNTTSDGRLKTNVRTFTPADSGPIIDGLRPVWFDWKPIPLTETVMQDTGEFIEVGTGRFDLVFRKDEKGNVLPQQEIKERRPVKKPVLVPVTDPKRIADHDADNKSIIGFIAQEEAQVSPALIRAGAVTVGDSDPAVITKQWQRNDAALIPILVAEIKALRARVAALEAEAKK